MTSTDNSKLGLIAYTESGYEKPFEVSNFYIGPEPQQIEANVVVDGTLFSSLNFADGAIYVDGVPSNDINPQEIFNNQLIFIGSVSSRNCIGCADYPTEIFFYTPRGPLKPVNAANKAMARNFDFNHLRYGTSGIAFDGGDNPIDLQCMQALTTEDLATISAGGQVIGPNGEECDGIEPDKSYEDGGDIAVTEPDKMNQEYLVQIDEGFIPGITIFTSTKLNPLYIEFSPPDNKSFIFGDFIGNGLTFY